VSSGQAHQRESARETRLRIMSATVTLFDRMQYDDVTIEAVARASGVSKSTIYRHWPSRQRLVLDAFAYKTDTMTAISPTGDAIRDLRSYLGKLAFCLDFGGSASTVAGLIGEAVEDEEFAALFREGLIGHRRQMFEAILRGGQQRGQIRRDLDLETTIDALYGAMHHRLLVSRRPIDGLFVSALVDLVVGGFTAPP
jgi:AcrR family transcriptional regulator